VRARFLADADLDLRIVTSIKKVEPEIDFETAQTAALKGIPDLEVLRIAAGKNRVLVSHDRRTMPSAFYSFLAEQESPGLILLKQTCPLGRAIEELRACYHVLDAAEFINQIRYLPLLKAL
jgi:predicted nuclease of predicted toxin-antitoxin system